jgi:hypothetical protein
MSATLDVKPLGEIRDRLVREHIPHGYVDSTLDEPHRQINVYISNIGDLEQCAADLHLERRTSLVHRWYGRHTCQGWRGEVWLILILDVPRGIHGAPQQREA